MNRKTGLPIFGLLALSILAFACTPTSTPAASGKPSILLAAPAHGAEFREGETVIVQSASGDAAGIARVELSVDGALVRSDSAPSPQTYFNIVQNWNAMPGAHTLAVRVYNTRGIGSDPAAVSISVLPVATPSVTMASARAAPTPTNTVAPLRAATPTQTRLHATMPARIQEDTLYEDKKDYNCDARGCWRTDGALTASPDYFYPDLNANNEEIRALLNSIGLPATQTTDDREKWLRVQTVWV